MFVAGFPTGSLQANCFVLAAEAGGPCVVVDPGEGAEKPLDEVLRQHRLDPVAVLLTHGHFDHVFAVTPVCDGHDIPAWIHPEDRVLLSDPMRALSADARQFFGGRVQLREPREVRALDGGVSLQLAGLTLTVDHTPGHTRGSVTFRSATGDRPGLLISGDTLFAGSIGRTDLPGGDHEQMRASLRDKILVLDDDTVVLPGHGPRTTIGRERASNPFLHGLAASGRSRGL
ncbi:MAG TPA: MBL fold metallo-hydrolase [Pseudonocardiaceae bacterium]|nr:MBL fold metallo-hydrolase [Pseudonocardiaceae bacterium]